MKAEKKEVWLRGEITDGLSPLLQPVVDALLEATEEIRIFLEEFPEDQLWIKPAGCASVGFHLKHIPGVADRLLTYGEGMGLDQQQFNYLKNETAIDTKTKEELLEYLQQTLHNAIERLKNFPETVLTEQRKVGRAGLPSTVMGLCVHMAEHTMRHTGQLLVTIKCLSAGF